MIYANRCKYCDKKYEAKRSDSSFCADICRGKHHYWENKKKLVLKEGGALPINLNGSVKAPKNGETQIGVYDAIPVITNLHVIRSMIDQELPPLDLVLECWNKAYKLTMGHSPEKLMNRFYEIVGYRLEEEGLIIFKLQEDQRDPEELKSTHTKI